MDTAVSVIGELRQELEAVQERLDFIERVLPEKQDQPDTKLRT